MPEVRRDIEAVNCEVVHMETDKDIIVRTEDGHSYSLRSDAPNLAIGARGKLLIHSIGHQTFVHEPIGWDDKSDPSC